MTTWITTPHGLLAWAATYLLHSTVLLSAAWGVSRLLAGRGLRLEERLWKVALVGALLTATVQTGVASLPAASSPVERAALGTGVPAAAPAPAVPAEPVDFQELSTRAAAPVAQTAPDPRLGRLSALLPGWQRLALGAWAFGALLLVTGLAFRWVRLRRCLRARRDVEAGAPRRLLDRLLESTESHRRVRLTGSSALPVPVALGVGEQEICLPSRALRELDDRRQQGLLAHELAHLERRDPAWQLLALGLESVLFFQPLNRVARRRLEEIAELQCDAWAVRATGDRLGLARCLTEVAGWLLEGRGALAAASAPGASAMARRRGQLGTRIRRILASGSGDDSLDGRRRWIAPAAAVGLLALALLIPGLAPSTLASPGPAPGADPQVAPGAEGVAQDDRDQDQDRDQARERDEREAELSGHREADEGYGPDDPEHYYQEDWDVDLDFDESFDPEEIEHLVAEAMEAAHAGLLDAEEMGDLEVEIEAALAEVMAELPEILAEQQETLDELHREMPRLLAEAEREMQAEEGRAMTAEEREELRREIEHGLAEAREELRHAMEEMGPQMEELRRIQREVSVNVREEMRRAHEELERAERTVRQEVRREVSEEARAEMREARAARAEAEREVRREVERAEREMERASRELDEMRRELDREREALERERRALEEERRQLERTRRESAEAEEPPPGA
jgi:hypothetical protein